MSISTNIYCPLNERVRGGSKRKEGVEGIPNQSSQKCNGPESIVQKSENWVIAQNSTQTFTVESKVQKWTGYNCKAPENPNAIGISSYKIHPYNVLKPVKQGHFSGGIENAKNQENFHWSDKRKWTDVSTRMTDRDFKAPIIKDLEAFLQTDVLMPRSTWGNTQNHLPVGNANKATMRNLIQAGKLLSKRQTAKIASEHKERERLVRTWISIAMMQNSMDVSAKTRNRLTLWSNNPTLQHMAKKRKSICWIHVYSHVYYSTGAKIRNQTMCWLTNEYTKSLVCVCMCVCNRIILHHKIKEILSFVVICMELVNMLNEMSGTEK